MSEIEIGVRGAMAPSGRPTEGQTLIDHAAQASFRQAGPRMLTNIDVTLRDGGYRNGFSFPLGYAVEHAVRSAAAGLQWVEIAYRKGSFKPMPGIGLTGRGEDDYIRTVAEAIGPERVGLILHPKNITDEDLAQVHAAGARLVRVCLNAADLGTGLDTVRAAKAVGLTVAANFTRVTKYARRQLVDAAAEAAAAGADVIYLADSNGSLMPNDTYKMVTAVEHVVDCEIGLHAHNNLGLALANAIAAVDAGASWVDSSVLGMGKGPGNLVTEQWLAYLIRQRDMSGYRLDAALSLAELLRREIPESTPELPLPDLVLGWFDLTVEQRTQLSGSGISELFTAASGLAERERAA